MARARKLAAGPKRTGAFHGARRTTEEKMAREKSPLEGWRAGGGVRDARAPSDALHAIRRLAVRADVEAFALFLFGDAQTDDQVDDLVRDEGDDGRPYDRHADGLRLDPQLREIA